MTSRLCLVCPRSCALDPQGDAEQRSGQRLCPRGLAFIEEERRGPRRHFFSTCRDESGDLVPYRTIEAVPLADVRALTQALAAAADATDRQRLHAEFRARHATVACPFRKPGRDGRNPDDQGNSA